MANAGLLSVLGLFLTLSSVYGEVITLKSFPSFGLDNVGPYRNLTVTTKLACGFACYHDSDCDAFDITMATPLTCRLFKANGRKFHVVDGNKVNEGQFFFKPETTNTLLLGSGCYLGSTFTYFPWHDFRSPDSSFWPDNYLNYTNDVILPGCAEFARHLPYTFFAIGQLGLCHIVIDIDVPTAQQTSDADCEKYGIGITNNQLYVYKIIF